MHPLTPTTGLYPLDHPICLRKFDIIKKGGIKTEKKANETNLPLAP